MAAIRPALDTWMRQIATTVNGGDGSDNVHRMDLRPPGREWRDGEGSAFGDAEGDCGGQEEE